MRGSPAIRPGTASGRPSPSRPQPGSASRLSVDLAGRAVALSPDVPANFDEPLGEHHRLIGHWVASRGKAGLSLTRPAARRHIERVFDAAVRDSLDAVEMADFRTVVLHGHDELPPAIIVICDSIGQIDLGWIEESDAPIAWRAAAYKALEQMLGRALPVFGYGDLFEEISHYYWDGETQDAAARESLIALHGADPDEVDQMALPSEMDARRPGWMIADNAGATKLLPPGLRRALRDMAQAHRALGKVPGEANAWSFEMDALYDYVPGIEECSSLPPMTLVPVEQFNVEVDDVGRHGMEYGFLDVAGLCPLSDAQSVDDWFASLRIGAHFLATAEALIGLDPKAL